MRIIPAIALAAGAAALAGSAMAATPKAPPAKMHVMNVPLADGSSVRVEYAGDVAPRVTLNPGAMTNAADPWMSAWGMPMPSFAGFDRMIEQMNRQSQEMIQRARQMQHQAVGGHGAAPYVAAYSNLPAGETSTTVVTVSNGGKTCTRSTEVVSQGPGKAPKVTTNATGQCAAPAAPSAPIDRT